MKGSNLPHIHILLVYDMDLSVLFGAVLITIDR